MALKDHTIDSSKISEEQIETIISSYIKYDLVRNLVVLLPNAQKLSNERKILLYLVALRGWPFISPTKTPSEEASPQEISQKTHVLGGSVRPILKSLTDQQILKKEDGKYQLLSHNLGLVQEGLTSSERSKVISNKRIIKKSSAKGKAKKKLKPTLAEGFSSLLASGWFKPGKNLSELKDKLDEMTIFPTQGELPYHLLRAYRAEELDRKKEKVGEKILWVYYQKNK